MIEITPEMREKLAHALDDGFPCSIAAVTPQGEPTVSFRGTLQAIDGQRLGLWVRRNPSTLLESIAVQPTVVAVYANMPARLFFTFRGRARVETDEATRKQIWQDSPDIERNQDPEMKGIAVVVDVDHAYGRNSEGRFDMKREE